MEELTAKMEGLLLRLTTHDSDKLRLCLDALSIDNGSCVALRLQSGKTIVLERVAGPE